MSHLSAVEKRAYVLADNKLADLAGWDREILATELQGLIDLDFEVELTGFTTAAIDLIEPRSISSWEISTRLRVKPRLAHKTKSPTASPARPFVELVTAGCWARIGFAVGTHVKAPMNCC